jgi:hypothetical protein
VNNHREYDRKLTLRPRILAERLDVLDSIEQENVCNRYAKINPMATVRPCAKRHIKTTIEVRHVLQDSIILIPSTLFIEITRVPRLTRARSNLLPM